MTTLITAFLVTALAVLLATVAVGLGAALFALERRPLAAAPSVGSAEPVSRPVAPFLVGGVGLGAALLMAAILARALLVGHAPWSNLHEFTIAFAAVFLGGYLVLARSWPISGLAPLVALLAAGLVAVALGLDDRVDPLVPALQQPLLLTVHVGSAVLAYAIAGLAFVAAAAELGQRAADGRLRLLPPVEVARAVSHRAVLIGFPILTVAIALGSVWANLAWRSYWSNDPKELAAAATWFVFGAYLHVAGRRDRWERLAPWLIVAGFAGVLFTYIGAGLFIVGEHSYGAP
jgi:ABC-type transport system involved in cytochrome c biogenesis permease subunit